MQSTTLWRRRAIVMLVIGLLVAIPVTLLIGDSDDTAPEPERKSLAERLPLSPTVGDSAIEAVYQVPQGWKLDRENQALTLRSADDSVQIGITSPGPPEEAGQLLDEALASLEATYSGVRVSPGSGKQVGGLPAKGAVVAARSNDIDLRILVAVTEGEEKAYLVEVFTATTAPPRRVAEAQRFLNSLELKG